MSASNTRTEGNERLAGTIRRQLGTQANRRLLARLPVFAPQQGPLPDRLASLLDALDCAEDGLTSPGSPAAARSAPRPPASEHGRSPK